MAAKFLYSWTDENPDLQKQIGCMTGIFQIFDRQHIFTGRRVSGHSPKRLPSGSSHFNNDTLGTESNNMYHRPTAGEKNSTNIVTEKQRVSMESSRASFSSSCRSSVFSSLDYNRTAQSQLFDQITFPETPRWDTAVNQSSASPQFRGKCLDGDRDSMYREDGRLSVKTKPKEEPDDCVVKQKGYSLRLLAKHRDSTWCDSEARECSQSPCESKDGSLFAVKRDAARYSYDGSYRRRLSFESSETFRSTPKLKEVPRLSLDSRVGSIRSLNSDSKSAQMRPPGVVAKLMGLETLPHDDLASDSQLGSIKTCSVDDFGPFSRSSKPTTDHWENPESSLKPVSRSPVEAATWKRLGGTWVSQKPPLKHVKTPERETTSVPSVYSEIEKRLKDLEFTRSGKNMRALKQIIEAMQAREKRRKEQDSNFATQKNRARLVNPKNSHSDRVNSSAKHAEKIGGILPSSVIPMDCLSGLPNDHGQYADSRHILLNIPKPKEKIPKTGFRETVFISTDNRKSNHRTLKSAETSPWFEQFPKVNTISLVKSLGSPSAKMQQRKLKLEKRYQPSILPDSSKSSRQTNMQQPESGSPCGKHRLKSTFSPKIDNQSDDNSQTPSMKAAKYSVSGIIKRKLAPTLNEDGALAEFASVASEHPSPVSVLDDTMYKDDTMSPVKHMPVTLKGEGTMNRWDSAENLMPKSKINREKLDNVKLLVQQLRRLNSSHDEANTDYIAALCENANPDHRYVSEILLASGFLLRDLNSIPTTFQLNPINPELFLVLEQTSTSTIKKEESSTEKVFYKEKFHRKLIFDVVNEILVEKLRMRKSLARKSMNAQRLLRELCSEIDQLQAKKLGCGLLEDEDDWLKRISWENVIHGTENWTEFNVEFSGMVLDVERLIFKDLVDDVVHGEAAGFRTKPGRHCKQNSS